MVSGVSTVTFEPPATKYLAKRRAAEPIGKTHRYGLRLDEGG